MLTTLILSGGGFNALCEIGVYKLLSETNKLNNLKQVIAASAGSVIGFMICLGYTWEEMKSFFEENLHTTLTKCKPNPMTLLNVWKNKGLIDGKPKKEFIRQIIKHKLKRFDINFLDLTKLSGINFVVSVTNLSKYQSESFSVVTTPTASVVTAVHISSSIPILFYPVWYKDDLYVDGALFTFYPEEYCTDNCKYTLGCFVDTSPTTVDKKTNILQIISSILYVLQFCKPEQHTNCILLHPNVWSLWNPLKFDNVDLNKVIEHGYEKASTYFAQNEKICQ